jgi:hypothetical protein
MDALPPTAMTLRNGMPRMSQAQIDLVIAHLQTGCTTCRSHTGTMTRRATASGGLHACIQCDGCGKAVSNALRKAEHYEFMNYPLFDEAKREEYQDGYARRRIETREARNAQVMAGLVTKEEDYQTKLRSSVEWRSLRGLVLQRARFTCEACLKSPAENVHHLTYEYGMLPPAWFLRAVCRNCHDRIHADKHGKRDEWCLRSPAAPITPPENA